MAQLTGCVFMYTCNINCNYKCKRAVRKKNDKKKGWKRVRLKVSHPDWTLRRSDYRQSAYPDERAKWKTKKGHTKKKRKTGCGKNRWYQTTGWDRVYNWGTAGIEWEGLKAVWRGRVFPGRTNRLPLGSLPPLNSACFLSRAVQQAPRFLPCAHFLSLSFFCTILSVSLTRSHSSCLARFTLVQIKVCPRPSDTCWTRWPVCRPEKKK